MSEVPLYVLCTAVCVRPSDLNTSNEEPILPQAELDIEHYCPPHLPSTVELIPTLSALLPRGRRVQDPVLTPPPLHPQYQISSPPSPPPHSPHNHTPLQPQHQF